MVAEQQGGPNDGQGAPQIDREVADNDHAAEVALRSWESQQRLLT